MERGIVIGVGNIGCAAIRKLPDDPQMFRAFIAINHTDYIRALSPNDSAYRVPRYKITDPCHQVDMLADPVFVIACLTIIYPVISKLLCEATTTPTLIYIA